MYHICSHTHRGGTPASHQTPPQHFFRKISSYTPLDIMSKKISAIHEIKPAAEIVEELMNGLMNSF